ncbi:MAG: hypothetical protein IJV33_04900, partial [Bacteroidaceae bacterium]|nr:hypothetical protein [Bacteroidaceae bacterium]
MAKELGRHWHRSRKTRTSDLSEHGGLHFSVDIFTFFFIFLLFCKNFRIFAKIKQSDMEHSQVIENIKQVARNVLPK